MAEPGKPRAVEWDLQVDVVCAARRKKKIYLLLSDNIYMADLAGMERERDKEETNSDRLELF